MPGLDLNRAGAPPVLVFFYDSQYTRVCRKPKFGSLSSNRLETPALIKTTKKKRKKT